MTTLECKWSHVQQVNVGTDTCYFLLLRSTAQR
jgi:hypothetical protein